MNKTNLNDKFTCRVYQEQKAPRRIKLTGDKTRKPESAQHVIEFPGGAIELSRTSDGAEYWAHIIVHRDDVLEDCEGRASKRGEVVGSRIDYTDGHILSIDRQEDIRQIAVRIR